MQTNDVEMYVLVHISNTRSRKKKEVLLAKFALLIPFYDYCKRLEIIKNTNITILAN